MLDWFVFQAMLKGHLDVLEDWCFEAVSVYTIALITTVSKILLFIQLLLQVSFFGFLDF